MIDAVSFSLQQKRQLQTYIGEETESEVFKRKYDLFIIRRYRLFVYMVLYVFVALYALNKLILTIYCEKGLNSFTHCLDPCTSMNTLEESLRIRTLKTLG